MNLRDLRAKKVAVGAEQSVVLGRGTVSERATVSGRLAAPSNLKNSGRKPSFGQGSHSISVTSLAFVVAGLALVVAGCGPKYPNCKKDEDCKEKEFCVNEMCQQCRTSADCPTGQSCQGGRCESIPGYCSGTGDCPEGQECQNNRCVTAVSAETDTTPEPTAASNEPDCSLEPVYFQFDSENLDDSARNKLERVATCIRQRNLNKVHITGHCDPRGTEEYNLALGDRRAQSAKRFLSSLGVNSSLTTSSVGEEYASEDTSQWSQDRKVEFQNP